MKTQHLSYFRQTQKGQSAWWSWMAGTWLTFVGWFIFQNILIFGMVILSAISQPALYDAFMVAVESGTGSARADELNGIMFLAGLGVTGAVLTALIADGLTRRISNALALVGIVICIGSSVMASRLSDSSELLDIISQIMGASPVAFTLFLLSFPAALIGLFICQRAIHKRTITSLHTAAAKFRWRRVFEGFLLTWIVLGVLSVAMKAAGLMEVEWVFDPSRFWIYALVSLIFIPFQAGTEEIVFRGYFVQATTHLTRSKWIAFALTSVAFMALHLSNPEALAGSASGTLPIVMSGYFFFGFAMCLIVWIDDGLETAIGVHAGNNCFAAVIMNYENSVLPTPSIFLTGTDPIKDSISTVVVLSILVGIVWWRRGGPPRDDQAASDGKPSIADA